MRRGRRREQDPVRQLPGNQPAEGQDTGPKPEKGLRRETMADYVKLAFENREKNPITSVQRALGTYGMDTIKEAHPTRCGNHTGNLVPTARGPGENVAQMSPGRLALPMNRQRKKRLQTAVQPRREARPPQKAERPEIECPAVQHPENKGRDARLSEIKGY